MSNPIIIGNWKTNPDELKTAKKFISNLDEKLAKEKLGKFKYMLAVPDVFISELSKLSKGKIGSQNISGTKLGQETGLSTSSQAKSAGATFTLIGHSEVRKRGETIEERKIKLESSLKSKLITVLCIGEKERDSSGKYLSDLDRDLKETLSQIDSQLASNLMIAYEPIWAIGGENSATPAECFEVIINIRRGLYEILGEKNAKDIQILYGGTVNKDNAKSFIAEGGANGLLVGRSSQDVKAFFEIICSCN